MKQHQPFGFPLAVVVLLVVVLGHLGQEVTGYNVLMMLPFSSRSHKIAFDPVANELVRRGHKVTMMAPFPDKKEQPGVTNVFLEGAGQVIARHAFSFFSGTAMNFSVMFDMTAMGINICNLTLRDPHLWDILQEPRDAAGRPKFDLVVIDTIFGEFTLPIAHRLGVPAVYFSPGILFPYQAWSLDIPFPYSYVPLGMTATNIPMTFANRAINLLEVAMFEAFRSWLILPQLDRIIREILPGTPPLPELECNVSFVLTNTHPALNSISPKMPYTVEIGGVNCRPAEPLPKDLEDFMAASGDEGVVYFSLGSYTKGDSMPVDMKQKILETFSKLPQKVLWKYESVIEELPPNVRLITWAPQQDLLAHPKMRLFMTHGGLLSTHEAAYHGCPILGFPLSADQWGNMALAHHSGFSEYMDWRTFTAQELLDTIQTMISDPRYKRRALEVSSLYHDNLQPPAERAVYWLEYVIRHQGAPHLKSGARHLNFFQYFLLDVIGAALLLAVVVLGLSGYLLKKAVVAFCRWRCSKTGAKSKVPREKKRN